MSNKKPKVWLGVLVSCLMAVALVPILSGQETDQEKNVLPGAMATPPQVRVSSLALKPASPVSTTSLTLKAKGIPAGKVGVIALRYGSIKLVDPKTFIMYGPFLSGQLGASPYLLDVVLSKNGKTAILASFLGGIVYFVDLKKPSVPKVAKAVALSFGAEDIALAPNEKFALVTDGGDSRFVASLNIKTKALVQEYDLTPFSAYASAVAIAQDNKTVITVDHSNRAANVLLMDPKTGILGYVDTISLLPSYPRNVVISPNGKTAFAPSAPADPAGYGLGAVLSIPGSGGVLFSHWLTAPSVDTKQAHCAVFSKTGSKLYVLGSITPDPSTGFADHYVYVYDALALGIIAYSGTAIRVFDFVDTSTFFGVDVMAIEPNGKYLYITNHSPNGAENRVAIVDLSANAHVLSLIPCGEDDYPTGIAFKGK